MFFNKNHIVVIILFVFCSYPVFSWTDHFLSYYAAIASMPEVKDAKPVKIESFEDFISKEADGLALLIEEQEKYARENIPNYPAKPDSLVFNTKDKKNLRKNFLMALRLNPEITLGYYTQEAPGANPKKKKADFANITIHHKIDDWIKKYTFSEYKPGDAVPVIDVVATAGDEPDFGHDIGLYTDSETEWGKIYGFGEMPFGNKKYFYGTQAPFHIGYYHEAWIIFKAGGFLKRTMPEFRIYQFLGLAKYAFKTGHDYWGWRILGWALHYVGDLTQPYHSRVLPGIGTMKMLWISIRGGQSKTDAIERVSDRHTALEHYHYCYFENIYKKKEESHSMFLALRDSSFDSKYPAFTESYIRDVLTKESYDRSDKLDRLLENSSAQIMPFKEVNYDNMDFVPDENTKELQTFLNEMMGSLGAHLRNCIRSTISGK